MLDKILLELGIASLILGTMRIAELIEGDILDSPRERILEPGVDERGSSLDGVGFSSRECYEVDGVIGDIVDTGETSHGYSFIIDEPLTHLVWSI